MTLAIEGIWKGGKIVPLEDVELGENTKVMINLPENKSKNSLLKLAGVWKNDDATYNIFKRVYENRPAFKLQR